MRASTSWASRSSTAGGDSSGSDAVPGGGATCRAVDLVGGDFSDLLGLKTDAPPSEADAASPAAAAPVFDPPASPTAALERIASRGVGPAQLRYGLALAVGWGAGLDGKNESSARHWLTLAATPRPGLRADATAVAARKALMALDINAWHHAGEKGPQPFMHADAGSFRAGAGVGFMGGDPARLGAGGGAGVALPTDLTWALSVGRQANSPHAPPGGRDGTRALLVRGVNGSGSTTLLLSDGGDPAS